MKVWWRIVCAKIFRSTHTLVYLLSWHDLLFSDQSLLGRKFVLVMFFSPLCHTIIRSSLEGGSIWSAVCFTRILSDVLSSWPSHSCSTPNWFGHLISVELSVERKPWLKSSPVRVVLAQRSGAGLQEQNQLLTCCIQLHLTWPVFGQANNQPSYPVTSSGTASAWKKYVKMEKKADSVFQLYCSYSCIVMIYTVQICH